MESLTKATITYKHHIDKKRRPDPLLEIEFIVYLEAKNLKVQWVGRKLVPKEIRPLKVLERIYSPVYQVELPHGSSAHNIFHISCLTP